MLILLKSGSLYLMVIKACIASRDCNGME